MPTPLVPTPFHQNKTYNLPIEKLKISFIANFEKLHVSLKPFFTTAKQEFFPNSNTLRGKCT